MTRTLTLSGLQANARSKLSLPPGIRRAAKHTTSTHHQRAFSKEHQHTASTPSFSLEEQVTTCGQGCVRMSYVGAHMHAPGRATLPDQYRCAGDRDLVAEPRADPFSTALSFLRQ